MKNNKNSLKINIMINMLYEILIIIAPFITAPYVSRVLNPDGIGVYSYTNALISYFTLFASLGTITYGKREIAMVRDDPKFVSKKFWEIEILTFITSFICIVLWVIFSFSYKEYTIYMLILTLLLFNSMFDISWLYVGLEKFKYTVTVNSIIKIISIVAVFMFVKTPDDLLKYIFIYAGTTLLGSASMWLFLPKILKKTNISINSLKIHFKETLIYFVPTIASTVYSLFDKTFIGLLIPGTTTEIVDGISKDVTLSSLENGFYEQATKIISMIKTVSFYSINGVFISRACYLANKNDNIGLNKILKSSFNITLFLTIGAVFGLFGVIDLFVPIFFGDGYEKTTYILYILAILLLFACANHCLTANYFIPVGKRKVSSYFLVAGTLLNIVLNIPFIILWKSLGAAIASVIAEVLIFLLNIIYCRKYIDIKMILYISWKKIISGVIMLASIIFIRHFLMIENTILLLIFLVIIGGLTYGICLLILKDEIYIEGKEKILHMLHKQKSEKI